MSTWKLCCKFTNCSEIPIKRLIAILDSMFFDGEVKIKKCSSKFISIESVSKHAGIKGKIEISAPHIRCRVLGKLGTGIRAAVSRDAIVIVMTTGVIDIDWIGDAEININSESGYIEEFWNLEDDCILLNGIKTKLIS